MKARLLLFLLALCSTPLFSQTTSVPDDAFENYLETHNASGIIVPLGDPTSMGDGIANNDLVTTANISSVITLNVINLGISDLTGIEDFAGLLVLNCMDNALTSLDVNLNTNLQALVCSGNMLSSLTIGTKNALGQLYCQDNNLTSVDLTGLPSITILDVSNNSGLTNLNIGSNTVLERLTTSSSPIGTLNLSSNIFIRFLFIDDSGLTTLDVSGNTFIQDIDVRNNMLTSLDLSASNLLFNSVLCDNNNLTELNVKNGRNTFVTNAEFSALNNSLTCITVDDVAYSTSNWSNIDGGVVFSLDCDALGLGDFKLSQTRFYPNPAKRSLKFELSEEGSYNLVNLFGHEIHRGKVEVGKNTIDMSRITSGLYF